MHLHVYSRTRNYGDFRFYLSCSSLLLLTPQKENKNRQTISCSLPTVLYGFFGAL